MAVVLVAIGSPILWANRSWALTWAEARASAERRAPELQVAARRIEMARADERVAGALLNPALTVSTARESARLSTGVSVPLTLFGQRAMAVRAAEADTGVVEREARVTLNELRWNATVAWVDAWEASERARLAAVAATDAERLFHITEERFQAGTSPRLDVVRATADRARAAADARAAVGLASAAAARLAVSVGADPVAPPVVTGAPGVPVQLPALGALVEFLGRNPALERDRAQRRSAVEHVDLERRLRFPVVSAELMVNLWDPTTPGTDVIVGAAFELPVLSQRGGSIARAEGQRRLAESTSALDAAHLRADLAEAFHRTLAGGNRARELGRTALPAMEEARAMTEESYRSGRADLVRVLEAERAVLDLRLAEREAIATWARSFADLERVVGDSLGASGGADASR
jgi:outer membrane protein TolC